MHVILRYKFLLIAGWEWAKYAKKRKKKEKKVDMSNTVNPLLSPPGGLFIASRFEGGGGGA